MPSLGILPLVSVIPAPTINHMSEYSYTEKYYKGLTGDDTGTCFVAALELLSLDSFSDELYRFYQQAFTLQETEGASSKYTKTVLNSVLRSVLEHGGFSSLVKRTAQTFDEFEEVLNKLTKGGFRILIYVEDGHVVGLKQENQHWKVVGTWAPFDTSELLSTEEIFSYLYIPQKRSDANILAVPAERKNHRK